MTLTPPSRPPALGPTWSLGLAPLLVLVGGAWLFALLLVAGLFYLVPNRSATVEGLARFFRLPAAKVNGSLIPTGDWLEDRQALRTFARFQQSLGTAPTGSPSDRIIDQIALDRLIRNARVEQLARRKRLTVTPAEVEADFARIVRGVPTTTIAENLERQFGLSLAVYQRNVVKPFLLRQKLERAVAADESVNPGLKARAEEVARLVAQSSEPFEDLVARYSQDSETAARGGDLGRRRRGELPDEVYAAALTLKPDERSGLILSPVGYHIIELMENILPDPQGDLMVHPRQILIRAKPVDVWITEELRRSRVAVFVPQLRWDATSGQITGQP